MTTRPGCETPGRRTLHRQATVGGPPWGIPVSLLMVALVGQVAGLGALGAAAGDLARGAWYGPAQLAAAHLVGLAFLSVAIVAALLQLVPVVLRTPLSSPRRAAGSGAGLALGAWCLALGLWAGREPVVALGGTLVALAGAVVVADMATALVRARRSGTLGAPGVGLALAAGWFAVVLVLGATMAENRRTEMLHVDRAHLIGAHGAIAVLGWVGGTILAVSLRLAPMFALSHGYARRPGAAAVGVWHASVPVIAAGFLTGRSWLTAVGGLVLLAACALAGWFVAGVARYRRRRPEAPLVHLLWGLASVVAAVALMTAGWAGAVAMPRAVAAAALLAVVGMGAGVTSGHAFKVLPMLVWTGRYATLAGTPGAPRLSDLYPHRLAVAEQAAFAAGTLLLAGGVLAGSSAVTRLGAVLLAAAALAVLSAAVWCVLPRRVGTATASRPIPTPDSVAPPSEPTTHGRYR